MATVDPGEWRCVTCGRAFDDRLPGAQCPHDGAVLVPAATAERFGGDALLGRRLANDYLIFDILGLGGFGAVYRAIDVAAGGRHVAIKTIRPGAERHNADARARFTQEARLLERLQSRHIVRVFHYGEADDALFMALELVPGRSLKRVLRARHRLSPRRAVAITAQILDALAHAHALGLIHRDLKPANILVIEQQDDEVKVIDFGIAKVLEAEDDDEGPKTGTGLVLGTVRYMAPEQLRQGGIVGPGTDLYAVGIMFYEMLVGQAPFDGSQAEIAAAHLYQPAPPVPEELAPASLRAWVARVLLKNPGDRYADAQAMRAALLEALPGAVVDDEATASTPIVADVSERPGAGGYEDPSGPSSAVSGRPAAPPAIPPAAPPAIPPAATPPAAPPAIRAAAAPVIPPATPPAIPSRRPRRPRSRPPARSPTSSRPRPAPREDLRPAASARSAAPASTTPRRSTTPTPPRSTPRSTPSTSPPRPPSPRRSRTCSTASRRPPTRPTPPSPRRRPSPAPPTPPPRTTPPRTTPPRTTPPRTTPTSPSPRCAPCRASPAGSDRATTTPPRTPPRRCPSPTPRPRARSPPRRAPRRPSRTSTTTARATRSCSTATTPTSTTTSPRSRASTPPRPPARSARPATSTKAPPSPASPPRRTAGATSTNRPPRPAPRRRERRERHLRRRPRRGRPARRRRAPPRPQAMVDRARRRARRARRRARVDRHRRRRGRRRRGRRADLALGRQPLGAHAPRRAPPRRPAAPRRRAPRRHAPRRRAPRRARRRAPRRAPAPVLAEPDRPARPALGWRTIQRLEDAVAAALDECRCQRAEGLVAELPQGFPADRKRRLQRRLDRCKLPLVDQRCVKGEVR
ncbi:MAG: serine/threonine protein kinase [Myxococcales bacterium]|nr:serine/threonine protein kinase [Myxococcales bacterium]